MANNKKETTTKERRDEYTVVLIGCGGTGGLLARELARYIYSKRASNVSFSLALVDADRVAEHNVARQPFTLDDLGQFKVDCLSEAFSCLYNIKVNAYAKYIDTVEDLKTVVNTWCPEHFSNYMYDVFYHTIIIGGVDNHRARQVFHEYFETSRLNNDHHDMYYIDSANEFDYGTIVCGYRDSKGEHCPPRAFFFPDVLTDTGKRASELSCGEINVSAPQHLATNLMAANLIFSRFVSFVENGNVAFGVTSFYPFDCTVVHRDADSYGITNYLDTWTKWHRKTRYESIAQPEVAYE